MLFIHWQSGILYGNILGTIFLLYFYTFAIAMSHLHKLVIQLVSVTGAFRLNLITNMFH